MISNTSSFSDQDLKFKLPFGMIISGPSSSGKSTFLLNLVAEYRELIDPTPASILYCFGEMSTIVPVLQKAGISVYAAENVRVSNEDTVQSTTPLTTATPEGYGSSDFFHSLQSRHTNCSAITCSLFVDRYAPYQSPRKNSWSNFPYAFLLLTLSYKGN
uniref:Uncharacterized protein n=1 Tax=Globodera rostochiensis TaxID=31243 RepID=A0A914HEX1_GLORO